MLFALLHPAQSLKTDCWEPGQASILATLARIRGGANGDQFAIAAVDISTGTFKLFETNLAKLAADIARLRPRELVLPDVLFEDDELRLSIEMMDCAIQPQPSALFDSSRAAQNIQRFYGVSTLDGFGQFTRAELAAANAVIAYIEKTQIGERPALARPHREETSQIVFIDAATRANLELIQTLNGAREGSLLRTIDRTVSNGGARLLAERLMNPLTVVTTISKRHEDVAFWLMNASLRSQIRALLKGIADMPRAISRLALNRGGPRDLFAIASGLRAALNLSGILKQAERDLSSIGKDNFDVLSNAPEELIDLLFRALADDLPLLARDGGLVRPGFDKELDHLHGLSNESRKIIAGLQIELCQ